MDRQVANSVAGWRKQKSPRAIGEVRMRSQFAHVSLIQVWRPEELETVRMRSKAEKRSIHSYSM